MTEEGRSDENEANRRLENELANELINFANDKLAAGIQPTLIASAIRHAAANFTAFANAHGTDGPLATEGIMEDFLRMLEFYENHHRGKARTMTPLERLVEEVKNE
jgi:hypothetical protein